MFTAGWGAAARWVDNGTTGEDEEAAIWKRWDELEEEQKKYRVLADKKTLSISKICQQQEQLLDMLRSTRQAITAKTDALDSKLHKEQALHKKYATKHLGLLQEIAGLSHQLEKIHRLALPPTDVKTGDIDSDATEDMSSLEGGDSGDSCTTDSRKQINGFGDYRGAIRGSASVDF